MEYSIYQLKNGEDQRKIKFLNWKNLMKVKEVPEYSDYECVYVGEIKKGFIKDGLTGILYEIYQTFSVRRPKDFDGHSLAISDIIVIKSKRSVTKAEAYYIDTFGFKECSEFAIEHILNNSSERNRVCPKRD